MKICTQWKDLVEVIECARTSELIRIKLIEQNSTLDFYLPVDMRDSSWKERQAHSVTLLRVLKTEKSDAVAAWDNYTWLSKVVKEVNEKGKLRACFSILFPETLPFEVQLPKICFQFRNIKAFAKSE